jgi:hypothetical protein
MNMNAKKHSEFGSSPYKPYVYSAQKLTFYNFLKKKKGGFCLFSGGTYSDGPKRKS